MDFLFSPILREIAPANYLADNRDLILNFDFMLNLSLTSDAKIEAKIINNENNQRIQVALLPSSGELLTISYDSMIDYNLIKNDNSFKIRTTDNQNKNVFDNGKLYKIQIRIKDKVNSANNKFNKFSEWSNIIVLKCIEEPILSLKMNDNDNLSIQTLNPIFKGTIENELNLIELYNEEIISYRFRLYEGDSLLEQSNWLIHKMSTVDLYRFQYSFQNDKIYIIQYEIQTKNGYRGSKVAVAEASFRYDNQITNLSLSVEDSNIFCRENACTEIYLSANEGQLLNGFYILLRCSEKDDFKNWTEIQSFELNNDSLLKYLDYTIENGIGYRYALQKEAPNQERSNLLLEQNSNIRRVFFEYSYLLGEGKQLRLSFNNKISSIKRNLQMNKIETIGRKYPTILKNGNINYLEFPISGLISYHMDIDNTFLSIDSFNQKDILNDEEYRGVNLVEKNIIAEKIFRDKVESFLNNGKNKLFKSATEGNIIVNLMNVSLTPEETLGRMIYNFSATAYEIDDNTYLNLVKNDIINYTPIESILKSSREKKEFGQIIIDNNNNTLINNSVFNFNNEKNLFKILQRYYQEQNNELKEILSLKVKPMQNIETELIAPISVLDEENQEIPIKIFYNKEYNVTNLNKDLLASINLKSFTNPVIIDFKVLFIENLQSAVQYAPMNIALINSNVNPSETGKIIDFGQVEDIENNTSVLNLIKQQILNDLFPNNEEQFLNPILNENIFITQSKNYKFIFSKLKQLKIYGQIGTNIKIIDNFNQTKNIVIGQGNSYLFQDIKDNEIKEMTANTPISVDYIYQGFLLQRR